MNISNCTIKDLSIEAYDRLFSFLYENKIHADCFDDNRTVVISRRGLKSIYIDSTVVITAETGEAIELDTNDFYKIVIL